MLWRVLQAWAREPRKYGEVLNMVEQLAELLAVLHGLGLVHRDLKCARKGPAVCSRVIGMHGWRPLAQACDGVAQYVTFDVHSCTAHCRAGTSCCLLRA